MMNPKTQLILLSYGEVDYWDLMFHGVEKSPFRELLACFRKLAENVDSEIVLTKLPFIHVNGEIDLVCRSTRQKSYRGLRMYDSENEDIELIEWNLLPEEWEDNAWLMDSFIESNEPCHQYFVDCAPDDATVIVSFREFNIERYLSEGRFFSPWDESEN